MGRERSPFLAALGTQAIDLKGVARGQEVMAAADLAFQSGHLGGKKLDGTAALGADHVMVAAAVVLVLIAGDAVVESDLAGESAISQQLKSAVHGAEADAGLFSLHEAVQFLDRKVLASAQEGAQDRVTLVCLLEADPFEMGAENFLGFAHHLRRDGVLIVNALLQHASVEDRLRRRRGGVT